MDLEEYTQRLQELAKEGSKRAIETVIVPAANELLGNIKNRIVNEGKNSDGAQIGNYSTNPAYVEKEQFIQKSKFKPQGKTGERKFKSGAMHKSMYLHGGYKELRAIQGRETTFVNQEYSGATLLAYQMQSEANEVLLGLTNERAANIRRGNEKRFGRIYSATQQEINEYNDNVTKSSAEITTRILNG